MVAKMKVNVAFIGSGLSVSICPVLNNHRDPKSMKFTAFHVDFQPSTGS